MPSCGLYLVKNLFKDKVVFYWVNKEKGKKISPLLNSMGEAEDWWKRYMYSMYEDVERRRAVKDRRLCHSTRDVMKTRKGQKHISPGRRATDIPIKVDIDLYDKKLKDELSDLE